jgi:predicted metal-dependent hydrolase
MTDQQLSSDNLLVSGLTTPAWESKYLAAYSLDIRKQVRELAVQEKLAQVLLSKYPKVHEFTSDKALYDFTLNLKNEFMRNSEPLTKTLFDSKMQIIKHALGLHTTFSRVQGGRLKTKREIRVASLFKAVPVEFLTMIVVHELAHFKESDHNKAFFNLCTSIEPNYHQYELDLRVYLVHLALFKTPLW